MKTISLDASPADADWIKGSKMSDGSLTLRQMVLAVLKQNGEQMSYRDLSTVPYQDWSGQHARSQDCAAGNVNA